MDIERSDKLLGLSSTDMLYAIVHLMAMEDRDGSPAKWIPSAKTGT